ncbi:hypothetical protein DAPPUDRAFT_305450 [Daphnia pulex]|uniref:Uncharacterized protein n=1 Tax=Daphnia pulex TaxID=6669 RepID=E9FWM3_DAPPU|nr:hypothetical protein DAPPUDRAFT_305450 [Daphnia pulex]|eukprot:EFX87917.1 hypothetical protein DAPPUDRAFT_305450 [Daphnia pulex]
MAASERRKQKINAQLFLDIFFSVSFFFFFFFGEDSPPFFFGRGYASAKKYNHPTARDTPRRMCRCLLTWINKRPASLISARLFCFVFPRNFRRLKNFFKSKSNGAKNKNLSTERQKRNLADAVWPGSKIVSAF